MFVWRLCKSRHAGSVEQVLSGRGALENAGRWNSEGTALVYCADSLALATLEILVGLKSRKTLDAYTSLRITVPDRLIERGAWRDLDIGDRNATREFGDAWVREQRSAALVVPSKVIPSEFNVLLNPGHRDFRNCSPGELTPYRIDPRLKG